MRSNAYQNYLENEVLTADPMKLVVLLYQGALDSMMAARLQTDSGNQAERAKLIGKALSIVWELNNSLDMRGGRELSAQLAQLYGYVRGRLNEARFNLSDLPLLEAEQLLGTLLEAWRQCENSQPAGKSRSVGLSRDAQSECAAVDYAW